jgi:hypothetical protein
MMHRFTLALAASSLITACGAPAGPSGANEERPSAAAPGGSTTGTDGRPAAVPADFLATPAGFVHPSCVVEVQPGETILENGDIRQADGSARHVAPCAYPRFRSSAGAAAAPRAGKLTPQESLEDDDLAFFVAQAPNVSWFSADFKVPAPPANHGGQVIFLTIGIQPNNGSGNDLLAVLQWNLPPSNTNRWSIASWYLQANTGTQYHSAPVDVAQGDTISGYFYPAQGVYNAVMNQNGAFATQTSANVGDLSQAQILGGALYAFSLQSCDQLPGGAFDFFNDEYALTQGTTLQPTWLASGPRLCNASAGASGSFGYLTWLDH